MQVPGGLSYQTVTAAFAGTPLFEDKTWRYAPRPWTLSATEGKEIEAIGQACLEFYRALELLYLRSAQNRNILRNRELQVPWVATYLDRGKPSRLVEHARHKALRGQLPLVIRPDLLQTDEGFALTEMDSVPGGIGLTSFLNELYRGEPGLIGADQSMEEAFYRGLAALAPDVVVPTIAIVVSDEAATYRPEMEWLAQRWQAVGRSVHVVHPSELFPLADTLCIDVNGNPERVHVIYRFWELFDLPNLPLADLLMELVESGDLAITPPMRHFQEEKLNLALFHHHLLQDFWRENLSKRAHKLLQKVIPRGWIVDPVDLPPNAVLDAPTVGGRPIYRWQQLAEASQKERNLILKLSGFHENAWGARSVLLGSDASRQEWEEGLLEAIEGAATHLHILQEYRKPRRDEFAVFDPHGQVRPMQGRVRLCPYYFVDKEHAALQGVLATFCPADKKIIHGMRDAAMLPACIEDPIP